MVLIATAFQYSLVFDVRISFVLGLRECSSSSILVLDKT